MTSVWRDGVPWGVDIGNGACCGCSIGLKKRGGFSGGGLGVYVLSSRGRQVMPCRPAAM